MSPRMTSLTLLLFLVASCVAKTTITATRPGDHRHHHKDDVQDPVPRPSPLPSSSSPEDVTSLEEDEGDASSATSSSVEVDVQPLEKHPPATYAVPGSGSQAPACPRREDVHPCQCIEIPSKIPGDVETVAMCKNIRNHQVLRDALKGFQNHRINFFVLDSCKLPPFPNGLLHNVQVEWMEILNSTVQFQKDFFGCSKGCL